MIAWLPNIAFPRRQEPTDLPREMPADTLFLRWLYQPRIDPDQFAPNARRPMAGVSVPGFSRFSIVGSILDPVSRTRDTGSRAVEAPWPEALAMTALGA